MIAVVHHPDYVATGQPPIGLSVEQERRDPRSVARREATRSTGTSPNRCRATGSRRCTIPDYVAEVIAARVPREKERRIGFAVTTIVARRAQIVPGGTWLAAPLALERGFAANSAGGSHHALADTGAGYCVFNDLAIAAVRLVEEGTVARVLIVDCDVHQGDGTAALTARAGRASRPIRSTPRRISRRARRARRSTCRWPTARATTPISTRWKRR